MRVKQYATKVERIEAMQITADNARDIAHWSGGRYVAEAKSSDPTDVYICVVFPTLNGNIRAGLNSWIVKNLEDGTFDYMTAEEFNAKYHEIGSRSDGIQIQKYRDMGRGTGNLSGGGPAAPGEGSVNIQVSGPPFPNTPADQAARVARQSRTRDSYRR